MGKKRKSEQAFEVVVEDSREPAAYTIGNQAQQQQAEEQWEEKQEQPQQQQKGGGGYDQAEGDYEQRPGYHHVYPGGSRIDPDTLSYLTEVCEMLSGMSDPEEAQLLRSNVLDEISSKLLPLATDAASSTLLEQLLSGAPVSQLMQFLEAFTDGDQLWRLAGAAFGSHVAEKVLAWIHAAASTAGAVDGSDPAAAADGSHASEGVETLLEALVSAVEPHIVDYATDKHATHVARALLVVVTGWDVLTPPGKKQRQRQRQQQGGGEEEEEQGGAFNQQQPKGVFGAQRSSLAEKLEGSSVSGVIAAVRYPALLRRLVKCLPLFDPQQMSQLGKNTYGGPLLQAMLRAAATDESLLMLLLPPILGLDPSKAAAAAPGQRLATLTDSHVGRLLRDDCYSHLLEVAVAVMPQAAAAQGSAEPAGQGSAAEGAGQDAGADGSKKKKKEQEDGEAVQSAADGAAAAAAGKGVTLEDEFYERFLKGRLLPLCCHHCANFVIQAVLSATHNRTRVAAYVSELSPHLGDLLRRRRSGVVAALAAAAARAGPGPHQAALVAALSTALGQLSQWQGRTGTAHLAPALMTLDTQAVLGAAAGSSGSTTRLSTPGCAMLALLLGQFPAAAVVPFWESVGALQQGDVLRIAKDPSGSRTLEAALAVATAEGALSKRKLRKLKKKQKAGEADDSAAAAAGSEGAQDPAAAGRAALLEKLQGSWGSIVQVPCGRFLLEAVYSCMAPDQAEALVAEVAATHDQLISRCSWGSKVAKKLGLEAYLRSPEEWRKRAAAAANTRKEFQELLDTTGKHKVTTAAPPPPAAAPIPARAAPPAAADAAVEERQQQQQQKQPLMHKQQAPGEKLGKNARKKLRRKAEAAAAAAAAGNAAEGGKKQARVSAAEAAAGAEAGEHAAAVLGSSKEGKKKQKRKQQSGAEAAAGADASADAAANGIVHIAKKKRKKERKDAAQQGVSAGVDLVALLGYGGLSVDKQHTPAKKKKQ